MSGADEATLPQRCPDWCIQGVAGHQQSYAEGCEVEESRIHTSYDLVGVTVEGYGEQWRWSMYLSADPGPDCGTFYGFPFIEMETLSPTDQPSDKRRHVWKVDSGAARVLARQLLHFADVVDLQL